MRELVAALKMSLWLVFLTGIAYPLFITGIAQVTMPKKAQGDLVIIHEKTVGAALIGQKFSKDKYFWARPSANDYTTLPSSGSNLSPASAALKKLIAERLSTILKTHEGVSFASVPRELLYASASGLDPHISPKTALFQVKRIAKARLLDEKEGSEKITHLIHQLTQKPLFGEPVVNVLKLNAALDADFSTLKDKPKEA